MSALIVLAEITTSWQYLQLPVLWTLAAIFTVAALLLASIIYCYGTVQWTTAVPNNSYSITTSWQCLQLRYDTMVTNITYLPIQYYHHMMVFSDTVQYIRKQLAVFTVLVFPSSGSICSIGQAIPAGRIYSSSITTIWQYSTMDTI